MPERVSLNADDLRHINRPQATFLVTSANPAGVVNVAPYNIVIPIGDGKVLIGPRSQNDTAQNIMNSGEFCCGLATRNLIRQVILSARRVHSGQSEIDLLRDEGVPLSLKPEGEFNPPGLQETTLRYWCNSGPRVEYTSMPEKHGKRILTIAETQYSENDSGLNPTEVATSALLYLGAGRFTTAELLHDNSQELSTAAIKVPNIPQLHYVVTAEDRGKSTFIGIPTLVFEATHHPPAFFIGCHPSSELFGIIMESREFALSVTNRSMLDIGTINSDGSIGDCELEKRKADKHKTVVPASAPITYWCRVAQQALDNCIKVSDQMWLIAGYVHHISADVNAIEKVNLEGGSFVQLNPKTQPVMHDTEGSIYSPSPNVVNAFASPNEYLKWLSTMR